MPYLMSQAVDRGAALLDVRWPEWEQELDGDTIEEVLDLGCADRCILGLLWGTFTGGKMRLFSTTADAEAIENGFLLPLNIVNETEAWAQLTNLWLDAIHDRTGE